MRSSSRSPVRVDLPPLPVLLMRATLLTRPVSPSGCRGLTGRFEPIEPAFLDGIVTRGEIAADIETINRCIDDGTSCSRWAWLPLLGVPVAFIGSIFTLINQPTLSAGSAPSFDDTSQSMSWSSQIYWFAAFAVCGMAGMCGMMYGASELSRVLESAAGNACEEVTRKYSARRVLVRFSLRTQATLESYYDNGMGMGNGMGNGMGMGNQYGGEGNQYGGYSLRTRRLHFLVISRGAAPAIAGAIIEPASPRQRRGLRPRRRSIRAAILRIRSSRRQRRRSTRRSRGVTASPRRSPSSQNCAIKASSPPMSSQRRRRRPSHRRDVLSRSAQAALSAG